MHIIPNWLSSILHPSSKTKHPRKAPRVASWKTRLTLILALMQGSGAPLIADETTPDPQPPQAPTSLSLEESTIAQNRQLLKNLLAVLVTSQMVIPCDDSANKTSTKSEVLIITPEQQCIAQELAVEPATLTTIHQHLSTTLKDAFSDPLEGEPYKTKIEWFKKLIQKHTGLISAIEYGRELAFKLQQGGQEESSNTLFQHLQKLELQLELVERRAAQIRITIRSQSQKDSIIQERNRRANIYVNELCNNGEEEQDNSNFWKWFASKEDDALEIQVGSAYCGNINTSHPNEINNWLKTLILKKRRLKRAIILYQREEIGGKEEESEEAKVKKRRVKTNIWQKLVLLEIRIKEVKNYLDRSNSIRRIHRLQKIMAHIGKLSKEKQAELQRLHQYLLREHRLSPNAAAFLLDLACATARINQDFVSYKNKKLTFGDFTELDGKEVPLAEAISTYAYSVFQQSFSSEVDSMSLDFKRGIVDFSVDGIPGTIPMPLPTLNALLKAPPLKEPEKEETQTQLTEDLKTQPQKLINSPTIQKVAVLLDANDQIRAEAKQRIWWFLCNIYLQDKSSIVMDGDNIKIITAKIEPLLLLEVMIGFEDIFLLIIGKLQSKIEEIWINPTTNVMELNINWYWSNMDNLDLRMLNITTVPAEIEEGCQKAYAASAPEEEKEAQNPLKISQLRVQKNRFSYSYNGNTYIYKLPIKLDQFEFAQDGQAITIKEQVKYKIDGVITGIYHVIARIYLVEGNGGHPTVESGGHFIQTTAIRGEYYVEPRLVEIP